MYVWRLCIYVYIIFLLFSITCVFREFSMLIEGHLVEWLILAKCVTLLKYCVNKINKIKSYPGYPTEGKIKFENSHVFDIY